MVNGRINGTKVGSKYIKNLPTIIGSKSLPASSLTKSQSDCKIKINISIKNILRNDFKNVESM